MAGDPIQEAIDNMIAQRLESALAPQTQAEAPNYLTMSEPEYLNSIQGMKAAEIGAIDTSRQNYQSRVEGTSDIRDLVGKIDRSMLQTDEEGNMQLSAEGTPSLRKGFGGTQGGFGGLLQEIPVLSYLNTQWQDNFVDGTTTEGVATRDQLLAQNFRDAYESLKGGGQITEYESKTVARALNNLSERKLNDDEYARELLRVRNNLEKGMFRVSNNIFIEDGNEFVYDASNNKIPVTTYRDPRTNIIHVLEGEDANITIIPTGATPSEKRRIYEELKQGQEYIYNGEKRIKQ